MVGDDDAYEDGIEHNAYGRDAFQEQATSNDGGDVRQAAHGTSDKSAIPTSSGGGGGGGGGRNRAAGPRTLFLLTLTSNLFFVIAAALYLRMAVMSVHFAKTYGRGGTVLNESTGEVTIEYSLLYWNQLPQEARAAASTLGYDQQLWDSDAVPEEIDTWWECLSPDQAEAAKVLGFDQPKWDGGPAPGSIVCDEDETGLDTEGDAGEEAADVDVDAGQEAADVDAGDEAADEALDNVMDAEAQDNVMDAEAEPDEEEVAVVVNYYDMAWNDLPPEGVAAAEALGYDEQLWDGGGTSVESDEWWADLSPAQREAAKTLGYDEASWNGGRRIRRGLLRRKLDDAPESYSASANPFAADDKRYKNLYISASLFFVVVGMLDWFAAWPKLYPSFFVVAGLCGFASALYVMDDVRTSNIFNAVSVHFFALEALAIAWHHDCYHAALVLADGAFGLGSLIEVVLSYFYVFDEWADYDMEVAAFNATAQSLWVICSIVYTIHTIRSWPAGFATADAQSRTEEREMNSQERSSDVNEAWGDEEDDNSSWR